MMKKVHGPSADQCLQCPVKRRKKNLLKDLVKAAKKDEPNWVAKAAKIEARAAKAKAEAKAEKKAKAAKKVLKIGRLTITEIFSNRFALQIFATDGHGTKREFTSHKGGALEVYDFPGKAGLARFVGHLNKEGAIKLYQLAGAWTTKQAARGGGDPREIFRHLEAHKSR